MNYLQLYGRSRIEGPFKFDFKAAYKYLATGNKLWYSWELQELSDGEFENLEMTMRPIKPHPQDADLEGGVSDEERFQFDDGFSSLGGDQKNNRCAVWIS